LRQQRATLATGSFAKEESSHDVTAAKRHSCSQSSQAKTKNPFHFLSVAPSSHGGFLADFSFPDACLIPIPVLRTYTLFLVQIVGHVLLATLVMLTIS